LSVGKHLASETRAFGKTVYASENTFGWHKNELLI